MNVRRRKFLAILYGKGWGNTKAGRHLCVSPNYIYLIRERGRVPSPMLLELLETKAGLRDDELQILESLKTLDPENEALCLAALQKVLDTFKQVPEPV
jgi:hypothetical protein